MTPTNLIIVLTIIGFLMLASEVFVPGMVLGTLGALVLIAAIILAYTQFGVATGTLFLIGITAVSFFGFIGWMFAFPHTVIGRRLMLRKNLIPGNSSPATQNAGNMVGQTGKSLTPLRPSGTAKIDGRRVDVVAEGDFITSGQNIVVVAQQDMRIVVRAV